MGKNHYQKQLYCITMSGSKVLSLSVIQDSSKTELCLHIPLAKMAREVLRTIKLTKLVQSAKNKKVDRPNK